MKTRHLLSRDVFRQSVFTRDGNKCVICGDVAQDAHHIMERRLFDNGGYFLENGVSLCGKHHIEAEQTIIQPSRFYEILKCERILPDDFYEEFEYTKWGDIIQPNGTRIKGPLFEDESVQKILRSADMLQLYSPYTKYPRSMHLPWSESKTDDDRTLKNTDCFKGEHVVVTLKLDGENSQFYSDGYYHARSIDAEPHFTQSWARNFASKFAYELPEGWRVCGENLWAKHSIHYHDLDTFFYVFSIWDKRNVCLSWSETEEWCELLGMKTVPVIYEGVFDDKKIKEAFEPFRAKHEGYVVRKSKAFPYAEFRTSLAKFVRHNHVQTSNHWKWEKIEKNQLKHEITEN